MEDQFGGRTDDDLFYDDFEPVESEAVLTSEQPPQPEPVQLQKEPVASQPVAQPVAQPAAQPAPAAPKNKSLSASIYADKPAVETPATAPQETKAPAEIEKNIAPSPAEVGPNPPANAPTAPREKRSQRGGAAAATTAARMGSGANPRQKLTESELADKMEKMKLLSAEKAAKFEKAEKDEKQHAEAYARGMEDARKRRKEEAERRKRGEEDRKKLEDERAKNRERKLKAMGMKEGGWDEGKEAQEEEEARRSFKGANGGIRGTRGGGLGGSRYAREGDDQPDVDRFLDERPRGGRGRGRGGRGGGRGGRGGHEGAKPAPKPQSVPTPTDFPALPSDGKPKSEATPASAAQPAKTVASVAAAAPTPLPLSPPIGSGKWDDEMEELDEQRAKAAR